MICTSCGAETKILETQSDKKTSHIIPVSFRNCNAIRRRRECLKEPKHRFWSIEAPEDIWLELSADKRR